MIIFLFFVLSVSLNAQGQRWIDVDGTIRKYFKIGKDAGEIKWMNDSSLYQIRWLTAPSTYDSAQFVFTKNPRGNHLYQNIEGRKWFKNYTITDTLLAVKLKIGVSDTSYTNYMGSDALARESTGSPNYYNYWVYYSKNGLAGRQKDTLASQDYVRDQIDAATFQTVDTSNYAYNIIGGAANKLLKQTAANTTGFVDAPTASGQLLTYNGSALVWSVLDSIKYATRYWTNATFEPKITAGTTAQYWRGDKSWQTLDKTAVGLSNVTNNAQIYSLNSLTAQTQTFAIGTSGSAPAFSSATSTHTLNIPMASTASVTAGLISKTDYDLFNSKVDLTDLSATAPLTYNSGTGVFGLSYNATNLKITSSALNTIQDIATTSSPTFAGLTINGNSSLRNVLPQLTDTYDFGSSTLLWRKGWLSELEAVVFAENTITLLGGWFYVTKDQGTVAEDVDGSELQIDFGKTMTPNDFIVFRANSNVEYMQIGTLVSGTNYNVTRNLDGTGANSWTLGTPFAVLGYNGNGRLEFNAYDTPRISLIKQGTSYNSQTEIMRFGDLNTLADYSTETYGMFIGSYSGNQWMSYDATNGLRVKGTVTATSGAIGGWNINSTSIYTGTEDHSGYTTNAGDLTIYSNGTDASIHAKNFYIDAAGDLFATNATLAGAVTANTGYLGGTSGWVITSNNIKDVAGLTGLSNTVTAGDDIRFWAGHATPSSAPFRVTEAGALTATSASITGTLQTGTSGFPIKIYGSFDGTDYLGSFQYLFPAGTVAYRRDIYTLWDFSTTSYDLNEYYTLVTNRYSKDSKIYDRDTYDDIVAEETIVKTATNPASLTDFYKTYNYYEIYFGSELYFGDQGGGNFDVNLYKASSNILKTDDTFDALYYKVNGAVGTSGQVIRSNGTNGGVWSSIQAGDLPTGIDATKIGAGLVTSTEFGYLSAVTSDIQTQINSKQATITGGATTIDTENLTASMILTSDASGKVAASSVASSTLFTPAYGELYDNIASTTINTNGSTYVKWSGSTVGDYANVTGNTSNDNLTIDTGHGGKYEYSYSVSFTADTIGDYYWAILLNTSGSSETRQATYVNGTSLLHTINGSGILNLSAGDTIGLGCYADNGRVVTVIYANVSIRKVSN